MTGLCNIVNYFINNEPDQLICSLKNYTEIMDLKYSISESYKLTKDYDVLYEYIRDLSTKKELKVSSDAGLIASYYGPTMYNCSLIEKTLRNFYLFKRKDTVYTRDKVITLNFLLSEENKEIKGLLGKEQLIVLRYYLLSDENDTGYNIRNNLAHLSYSLENEQFTSNFLITTVLLFSVVSSIVVKTL